MSTRQEALSKVRASAVQADRIVASMRSNPNPSEDFLEEGLQSYTLAKLRLHLDEVEDDSLDGMMLASLAKTLKVAPQEAAALDTASTCENATSVAMKRSLLFMAIERDFSIELDAEQAARATTIADLAHLFYAAHLIR